MPRLRRAATGPGRPWASGWACVPLSAMSEHLRGQQRAATAPPARPPRGALSPGSERRRRPSVQGPMLMRLGERTSRRWTGRPGLGGPCRCRRRHMILPRHRGEIGPAPAWFIGGRSTELPRPVPRRLPARASDHPQPHPCPCGTTVRLAAVTPKVIARRWTCATRWGRSAGEEPRRGGVPRRSPTRVSGPRRRSVRSPPGRRRGHPTLVRGGSAAAAAPAVRGGGAVTGATRPSTIRWAMRARTLRPRHGRARDRRGIFRIGWGTAHRRGGRVPSPDGRCDPCRSAGSTVDMSDDLIPLASVGCPLRQLRLRPLAESGGGAMAYPTNRRAGCSAPGSAR